MASEQGHCLSYSLLKEEEQTPCPELRRQSGQFPVDRLVTGLLGGRQAPDSGPRPSVFGKQLQTATPPQDFHPSVASLP